MMTAMVPILSLYALGIIPFPNLYVTWFEHSRPALDLTSISKTVSPAFLTLPADLSHRTAEMGAKYNVLDNQETPEPDRGSRKEN